MVDSFYQDSGPELQQKSQTGKRAILRNISRMKPIDYLLELLSHDDRYPSDHLVLYADELSCVVHSETLYKALSSLKEKQRKVLLFDFWGSFTDREIAKRMEVTPRTVYNLRQRAFQAIKKLL